VKQYAVVRDTYRNEPFGYVIKSGNQYVAYGAHAAGNQWAADFNSGLTKTLQEGLPVEVEIGRFGAVTDHSPIIMKSISSGSLPFPPEPKRFSHIDSESYVGDEPAISDVRDRPISAASVAFKQVLIDYKAAAFQQDTRYLNVMAKARLTRAGFTRTGTGLQSKSLSEAGFEHVANGASAMRRATIDLAFYKEEYLDQMGYWTADDIEEKKLGPTLRRGARAAEPYDPNAIDGDEDGIVQDGTPFERPATPRARMLGRMANQARAGRSDSQPATSARRSAKKGFASGTPRPRKDEPGLEKNDIAGDMTLDEVGYLEDALKMVMKDVKDQDAYDALKELQDALENAGAANDMVVMDRNAFNTAREAVDQWVNDNLPGGDAVDLMGVMADMADADSEGNIWTSLALEEAGTRLSMPSRGFASSANRNADTKQTIDGNTNFDPIKKRSANSTRDLLQVLEDNGFVWQESSDGYKLYPPDRIRNWILANTRRDEGGFRGSDHVLIHRSDSGKEDVSLKRFISQNLGGEAWADLKANAKKKGDLKGSGKVGPVESVIPPGGGTGFGSAARMRDAAATRAAAPRGFAARAKKGKGKIPGIDKVDARDGQAWSKLTPEQQATLKESLQAFEDNLLKTIAQKFPPFARGFFKDFRDKPYDKNTFDPKDMRFKDTEELLQFARYLEERVMTKDELKPEQKLTIQRYLDNISALTRMRLNDNYENIEHLHEAARKSAFKIAQGKDENFPSLGKVGGGGDSTFFGRAAGLNKDTFDAIVAGTEDAKLGKFRQRLDRAQRRLVTDILRPNPQRQARRAARKARRRGGANVGGYRTEQEKLSLTERTRRAAGRLRRRARRLLTGRKDEKKVMDAIDKKEGNKAIRDVDGKIILADDAPKRLKTALAQLRSDPDALKEVSNKGNRGEADISQSREMAVLWHAQGFNGLPELLTEDELFALADAGHMVIVRGHGEDPQNASDYLNDPLRYLPGKGGSAAGLGEYWSDALTGDGWFGWLKDGNTNTVAVLPKNAKIVNQSELEKESTVARKFQQAWALAKTDHPSGMDKSPLDEVVASLKREVAKMSDADKQTRVGQIITQLLDKADNGDADSISGMELIHDIAMADKNLMAPLLGYDAIRVGQSDGRILVMSRPSVAALDKAVDPKKAMEWVEVAKKVRSGEGAVKPGAPAQPAKATKLGKASGVPDWTSLQAMKRVQGPLGSQGGQWYEDSSGQRYLAKPAKSAGHAANEAAVAAIYREFNVGSQTAAIPDASGNPQVLVVGAQIQPANMTPALQAEAKKNMGIDMLLSNWDAYGAGGQNVGVDPNGRLLRLDAGGGGRFRAQGGDKPSFAPGQPWQEPASMITTSFGQSMYGTVTNGDMASAMRQVANIDIAKMDAAMKAAGVDDATRKLFRDTIADRKREAVRLEGLFATADAKKAVVTTGNGAGSTVKPG
jgi:hypothetical protein